MTHEITTPTTFDYSLNPNLSYFHIKTRVEFIGSCLKQDKITWNHGKIVKISIVYEISKNFNISTYPTLENCLFGTANLTKNADIDRHKYFEFGIGFDRHAQYSVGNGVGKNVIIFGVDGSLSPHIDNNNKKIF